MVSVWKDTQGKRNFEVSRGKWVYSGLHFFGFPSHIHSGITKVRENDYTSLSLRVHTKSGYTTENLGLSFMTQDFSLNKY